MGWASGSELAEQVWLQVRQYVPTKDRHVVARSIIAKFEDNDADTMEEAETLWNDSLPPSSPCECCGKAFGCDGCAHFKSAAELMADAGIPNMLEGRTLTLRIK